MKKKSYAIIGNPITHSLSPILHNYWFEKYKIEANYVLLGLEEDGLEELEEQLTYGKNLLETVLPAQLIKMVKQMSEVKDAAIAHKYDSCTITYVFSLSSFFFVIFDRR